MCLGIPAQIVAIPDPDHDIATVDVDGVTRDISIRLLVDEDVKPGDWVLVHVGFAMSVIDEREAALTLDQVRKLGQPYADEMDAFAETAIR